MLKVVVFNSPPRAGKGECAKYFTQMINTEDTFLPAYHLEFKDVLFKMTAAMLDISIKDFKSGYDLKTNDVLDWSNLNYDYYNKGKFMWYKDYPIYKLGSETISKRQALIHCSEKVVKPFMGESAFGSMLVNSLPEEGYVFVSDSGFAAELQPVIDYVGVENVTVVRISRDGCTFDGDSRSYLEPEMFENPPKFIDFENNYSTLEEMYEALDKVIDVP